jgi:aspartate aminotransferase-like enzyme
MTTPPRRKTLFVPGPTEVRDEVLAEMSRPMIAHRHADFTALCREIFPKLPALFGTKHRVMVATGSATGLMEAALRNTVKRRALCLVSGAFGERWRDIAKSNGVPHDSLDVEWGKAIRGEAVRAALAKADYDAVTLVHNETSTGVMNPLPEIAAAVRESAKDALFLVDTVSSLGGVPIDADRHGIDVGLAGVQKALALPPGLVLFSVSERAFSRAESIPNRGYFLDFLEYRKFHDKFSTPQTPAVSIFYALRRQLERIELETLEKRFERHREMARLVRAWARERSFSLFAEAGFEAETLTCVANTRDADVEALSGYLAEHGLAIADGYGPLKGKTFRIAHMGDLTPGEVRSLLERIDAFLGATVAPAGRAR